jgi:uracil-DNA glycosylase family 4
VPRVRPLGARHADRLRRGEKARALAAAGIERAAAYVTNVVKHFSWEPRGTWRIHKKPNGREIAACQPWLDREIALVRPRVVVCLGATAAQALLGAQFRVTRDRGRFVPSPLARHVLATVHPSTRHPMLVPVEIPWTTLAESAATVVAPTS